MLNYSRTRVAIMLMTGAVTLTSHTVAIAQQPTVQRKVLLQQDLTIPGYQAVLVSVEIPVGGREGRHTHPGSVLVHVEEGALTLDYEGKPTVTYKVGESFYVEPGKVHEGINRGTTPIKAVATFIVEKGKPLTTQEQK
jgi:quercetin dioxygenase-like cupin family protein